MTYTMIDDINDILNQKDKDEWCGCKDTILKRHFLFKVKYSKAIDDL